MTCRLKASRQIHRRTEIVPRPLLGLTQMKPHPHPKRRPRPNRQTQHALRRRGGHHRVRCPFERHRETVTRSGTFQPSTRR